MNSKFGDRDSIQNGQRVPIGYYKHNGPKPIVNTRRDFETASYSETTEVPPGIYPIYPGWRVDGRHGGQATLYIELQGRVTHDFFPSSLGGVIYGDTSPKHINEPRTITQGLNIARAIKSTGNSPNKTPDKEGNIPPDIYIDPKHWDDIKQYFEKVLKEDIKYFKENIEKLESGEKSIEDLASTLRYCSACVHDISTTLGVIQESQRYLVTPTFSKLHESNTKWVPKKEPKVKKAANQEMSIG